MVVPTRKVFAFLVAQCSDCGKGMFSRIDSRLLNNEGVRLQPEVVCPRCGANVARTQIEPRGLHALNILEHACMVTRLWAHVPELTALWTGCRVIHN
ncbi:hypothetical protein [Pseudomonas matsuisoli]|uniref:Uncharacterized protein n=1 Tax=Pseudomonas matsuisoli TaxID=1515666 RepID=A0A917PZU9_9PSED|nr:hypothetical protein [Pseudomonas matsuisoli]GGK02522.1 hypothetical protein GCM10009304_30410 [Pseudomonas matsuisoli]